MKKHNTSTVAGLLPVALLLLGSGCSTMKVAPLTTGNADSYTQHEQKSGVVVGIRPMTDKREIKDMFKVNLLFTGMQAASTASVIEFNLADKEFYTWTLGPGEKTQGGVNVTDELRKADYAKWNIPIGQTIATNAPVLARQVFDDVVDISNGQLPANETVAATLTPKVAYITRTEGAIGGGESIVDIKVEWTLSDAKGNTIWVNTVDGRSSASTRTNIKKVSRKALEDLLLKSEHSLSSAQAIKQFAQKKPA